jgi:hypothetical protein
MYIMEPELSSMAYIINPSHQSMCMHVYPLIVARQLFGKNVTGGNEYTSNNRRIFGHVVFYAVRVLSKESRLLVLPRTSCYALFTRNSIFKGFVYLMFFFLSKNFIGIAFILGINVTFRVGKRRTCSIIWSKIIAL